MFRLAQILLASLVVFVPTMSMAGPAEDAAAAIDRWAVAYSANDVEAMLKVYAPDAILQGTSEPQINVGTEDLRKYFRALRRAQRDIDLRPELYTHYYKKEFPARFLEQMDTRRWGPGERIVFEPYTKEVFEESFKWIAERRIFAEGDMGPGKYEDSVISLAA